MMKLGWEGDDAVHVPPTRWWRGTQGHVPWGPSSRPGTGGHAGSGTLAACSLASPARDRDPTASAEGPRGCLSSWDPALRRNQLTGLGLPCSERTRRRECVEESFEYLKNVQGEKSFPWVGGAGRGGAGGVCPAGRAPAHDRRPSATCEGPRRCTECAWPPWEQP